MKYEQLKGAAAFSGVSISELARVLGTSTQNLTQKAQRGRLTDSELSKIAEIIGAKYINCFEFKDGTRI